MALWIVLNFALVGEGTPAPFDPTKKLVTVGLFKHVRNPMYLGAELVMLGEAMLVQSASVLLLAFAMWVFFHVLVVYYEEPNLKKKFGSEYEDYLCKVPRWLQK